MRIPTVQYERLIAGATITVHTPAIPASITKGDTTNVYGYRIGRRRESITGPTRAHIRSISIHPLADITITEIRAAGWRTREAWILQWMRDHGRRHPNMPGGWDGYVTTNPNWQEDVVLDQFHHEWARRTVYRVVLAHDPTHQPRLLHKHSQHGYTDKPHLALRHEPEVIR